MKILKTTPFIAVACLVIGAGGMYFAQNFTINAKHGLKERFISNKPTDAMFNRFFNDESIGRSGDPFEEIRRMRDGMVKQVSPQEGGGLFDSWFKAKFGSGGVGDIARREDSNFHARRGRAPART